MEGVLYKYLDEEGGIKMLSNGNLRFTNATQLNDPFDCHPGLIDFSDANTREAEVFGKKLVEEVETSRAKNQRYNTWICSLSKTNISLLMWSYYNNHKGVCIGLDREKTKACLKNITQSIYIGALEMEVQYKKIIEKPNYFRDRVDFLKYQLSTKANDWAHEREVRLLLIEPLPNAVPHHPAFVDWGGSFVQHDIDSDCFESLYLGIKLEKKTKEKIIKIALKRNPNIKIYQMRPDPKAFQMQAVLL